MQSFNTKADDAARVDDVETRITLGRVDDLTPGTCARFELPDGNEIAVFNVSGSYYAIDNYCPHRGAPLNEGSLCGHVVECALHGWQFDIRTGECLTLTEQIRTFEIEVIDGVASVKKDEAESHL